LDQKDPVSLRCDFDTSTDASAIETADLVEISGRVKWFDAAKGYGFVVPDNGTSDVLLHIVTLRKDGFKTAYEGARIVCEAIRRAKGLQVLKIVSMDGPGAVPPSEWRPSRARAEMMAVGGFQIAIVKWFNRTRGFGFLTQGEGTQDIFVHMETLRRYGIGELRPGESLLVRYGDGPKGLMAAEVRPLDLAMPAPH
jgi:CspA family cold shock protein